MRFLLTGGSGLVGASIIPVALRRGHQVIAIKGSWPGDIPGASEVIQMDLNDLDALQVAILDRFPDVIINAAGITEPGLCLRNPEGSARLNVEMPEHLARLAHHLSARFIHLSSEQVFDGTRPPYFPTDETTPCNLYGRQKAASEERVHAAAAEVAVTLRLPLLNGNALSGSRSLHERLFSQWASGQPARLFSDEIRQPASADNVAEAVVELCERTDLKGIHHWAGAESVSRLDLGRRILHHFGLPEDLVVASVRSGVPGGTDRPADLSLDLSSLAGILKTPVENLEVQIDRLKVPAPCRDWFHAQS
jgi:dTDP-4-dehydrorhamnose reductase